MSLTCPACEITQVGKRGLICAKCRKDGVERPTVKATPIDREWTFDCYEVLEEQLRILRARQKLVVERMESGTMAMEDEHSLRTDLDLISRSIRDLVKEARGFQQMGLDRTAKLSNEEQLEQNIIPWLASLPRDLLMKLRHALEPLIDRQVKVVK